MKRIFLRRLIVATALVCSSLSVAPAAFAQAEPFLGQVMWVGFNFCPTGWAAANGQLLSISQNSALFSLLGTYYGGDGRTTFALPDLRGRTMVHVGQGAGLSNIDQGQSAGAEQQTLSFAQMPAHSHTATTTVSGMQLTSTLRGSSASNNTSAPAGAALGVAKKQTAQYVTGPPDTDMAAGSVESTVTGGTATTTVDATSSGTAQVPVRDPYVALNACIALQGIFPSRP